MEIDENSKRQHQILSIANRKTQNLEIALWAVQNIEDYYPSNYPLPPHVYTEYTNASDLEKSKVKDVIFKKRIVVEYFEEFDRIKNENLANYEWLKIVISYLPDEHKNAIKLVKDAINSHETLTIKPKISNTLTNPKMKRYESGMYENK